MGLIFVFKSDTNWYTYYVLHRLLIQHPADRIQQIVSVNLFNFHVEIVSTPKGL